MEKYLIDKKNIVLVEDESALLRLQTRNLSLLGYNVIPYDNPTKALEYITKNYGSIDILLTDRLMPEIKGEILISETKGIRDTIKTILMSGYNEDESFLRQYRIDKYLPKPFTKEELKDSIDKVLIITDNP